MSLPKITALRAATAGSVVLAGVTFSMSFTALTELAAQNGVPSAQAWGLPIAIDGLMVVATASTVALKAKAAIRYAYFALVLGTGLSILGNGLHAATNGQGPIGIGIGSLIPIILFIATHLTLLLARERNAETVVESPVAEPVESAPAEPTLFDSPVKKDLVAVG